MRTFLGFDAFDPALAVKDPDGQSNPPSIFMRVADPDKSKRPLPFAAPEAAAHAPRLFRGPLDLGASRVRRKLLLHRRGSQMLGNGRSAQPPIFRA
jgi:hypothetical protein